MMRQSLKYAVSLALIVGLVWFGVTSFNKSLTPYRSFADARKDGGYVQVNGTLADRGAVVTDAAQGLLLFQLKDSRGEVMEVVYKGVKPANFEQATSVVALGAYEHGRFQADKLLVKCPSKYQAEGAKKTGGFTEASQAPAEKPKGGGI
jgi:cytochrome c-type biogenesis protein CcmE